MFLIFWIGKGQQQVWDQGCIYLDVDDATFGDVVRNGENGYVAVGSGSSGEILLVKIDSIGNLVWAKLITVGSGNYNHYYANIINTSDGGYLVTGGLGYTTGCGFRAVILKTDGLGNVIWAREMGPPTDCSAFFDAIETGSGTYVAVGYTGPSMQNQGEIYLTEWDNSGNLLNQVRIGDNGPNHDEGRVIVELPNGHYVIASVVYRGTSDLYLIEYNPATNAIVKEKLIDFQLPGYIGLASAWEEIYDLYYTSDGKLLTCGSTEDEMLFNHYLIVKLGISAADFLLEWALEDRIEYEMHTIREIGDGNYIVGGRPSEDGNEFVFLKLTPTGSLIWGISVHPGLYYAFGNGLTTTSDNGFLMVGYSYPNGLGDPFQPTFVKVNSSGVCCCNTTNYTGGNNPTYVESSNYGVVNSASLTYTTSYTESNLNTSLYAECQVILPILFHAFHVSMEGERAHLQWQVEGDETIERFVIERSNDGKHFEIVGTIFHPFETLSYHDYYDELPVPGIYYYRIQAISSSGESVYSPIRSVRYDEPYSIQILSNGIQIFLSDQVKEWKLTNLTGQILLDSERMNHKETLLLPLHTSGLYLFHVTTSQGVSTTPIPFYR